MQLLISLRIRLHLLSTCRDTGLRGVCVCLRVSEKKQTLNIFPGAMFSVTMEIMLVIVVWRESDKVPAPALVVVEHPRRCHAFPHLSPSLVHFPICIHLYVIH